MIKVETHPLKPFLPSNAKLLMLGSFPPPQSRWKMDFYYPNYQNDMWRIFGLIFFKDKNYFLDLTNKNFQEQNEIKIKIEKMFFRGFYSCGETIAQSRIDLPFPVLKYSNLQPGLRYRKSPASAVMSPSGVLNSARFFWCLRMIFTHTYPLSRSLESF